MIAPRLARDIVETGRRRVEGVGENQFLRRHGADLGGDDERQEDLDRNRKQAEPCAAPATASVTDAHPLDLPDACLRRN
ncbi:MAG TPA: hypothetical protein VN832_14095 [Stellaceae bacterium]|nr:hypothetical protein [Stellaceae bacterium]